MKNNTKLEEYYWNMLDIKYKNTANTYTEYKSKQYIQRKKQLEMDKNECNMAKKDGI